MPAVVVDIAPPEPPRALTAALVDACSASVETGRCFGDDRADAPASAARATVTWETAARLRAIVRVTLPSSRTRKRTLDFAPADEEAERFRAVGLTIATLASELVQAEETESASPGTAPDATRPPPSTESAPPRAEHPTGAPGPARVGHPDRDAAEPTRLHPEKEPPRRLWATAFGVVGSALSDGTGRYGGGIDVALRPSEGPWFVSASGDVTFRGRDSAGIAAQWKTVVARVGAVIPVGKLALEPTFGVGFENLDADVRDPGTGRRDSGDAENLAFHLGMAAEYSFGPLALVLGLDGSRLPRRTDIFLKDREVLSAPPTSVAGAFGIRVFLE
ncbi:MAG TPA: hypothetical protein VHE30_27485 [Polyangiaceae bacterium]|nr:hypothetical protein [Polyangiaceae bacterium]